MPLLDRDQGRRFSNISQPNAFNVLALALGAIWRGTSSLQRLLSGSEYTFPHHALKPIFLLDGLSLLVANSQCECRLVAKRIEILLSDRHREEAKNVAVAISGFVAMLFQAP